MINETLGGLEVDVYSVEDEEETEDMDDEDDDADRQEQLLTEQLGEWEDHQGNVGAAEQYEDAGDHEEFFKAEDPEDEEVIEDPYYDVKEEA